MAAKKNAAIPKAAKKRAGKTNSKKGRAATGDGSEFEQTCKNLDDLEQEKAVEAELRGKSYEYIIDESHLSPAESEEAAGVQASFVAKKFVSATSSKAKRSFTIAEDYTEWLEYFLGGFSHQMFRIEERIIPPGSRTLNVIRRYSF